MPSVDRTARLTGVLFLLTFASAIAGAVLYLPLLTDRDYVLGPGADTRVLIGVVCEIVLVVTNLGTALVLYPVLRRHHETAALAYVVARIMECALIVVGLLAVVSVVELRRAQEGADADASRAVAQALVAVHDATFLLGPGFVVGIGNGLLLGFLLYRAHLVPRLVALLGLLGGPLMSLSGLAVLFGAYEQTSVWSGLLTLPEIAWELFLGVYLTVHGFRRARVPAAPAARVGAEG